MAPVGAAPDGHGFRQLGLVAHAANHERQSLRGAAGLREFRVHGPNMPGSAFFDKDLPLVL
jgi:hypothetical protein